MEELGMSSLPKIRLLVAIVLVVYMVCVAEGFRQFHRIKGKYKYDPDKDVKVRESVFRQGYSVVSSELSSIEQFVEWLPSRIGRPLKVPKRIVFFTNL